MNIELPEIGIRILLSPIGDGELPFKREDLSVGVIEQVIKVAMSMAAMRESPITLKYLKDSEVNLDKEGSDLTRNVPDLVDSTIVEGNGDVRGFTKSLSSNRGCERMTPNAIVEIYNATAKEMGWQTCKTIGSDLNKRLLVMAKNHPDPNYWHTVMIGWKKNPWFSGSSGVYTRVKIRTMVVKARYEDFFEDGDDSEEVKPKTHADRMVDYLTSLQNGEIDADGNPLC